MSSSFPSTRIAQKNFSSNGAGTAVTHTVTVAAQSYAVLYKVWVSHDADGDTDIAALNNPVNFLVQIGGVTVFQVEMHTKQDNHGTATSQQVHPGIYEFDFGPDGLYDGVKGNNLAVTAGGFGTGILSNLNIIYSGDSVAAS